MTRRRLGFAPARLGAWEHPVELMRSQDSERPGTGRSEPALDSGLLCTYPARMVQPRPPGVPTDPDDPDDPDDEQHTA